MICESKLILLLDILLEYKLGACVPYCRYCKYLPVVDRRSFTAESMKTN